MDHAVTVGNVLTVVGIVFGLFILGGGIILLLTLLNPFRSGH